MDTVQISDPAYKFSQLAEELSLDFANTVGNHKGDDRNDHLNTYADLLEWSRQLGVLSEEEAATLAGGGVAGKDAVLQRAYDLREAIYMIFSAVASGAVPRDEDLGVLNEELAIALSHMELSSNEGHFAYAWKGREGALDNMLWPVAWSAAELLTRDAERLERVTECAGDTCGWLFVDMSRNHSRHWCDMKDCGNKHKARRHYERKKLAAEQAVTSR